MKKFEDHFSADDEHIDLRLWEYIDGLSHEASVIEKLVLENSLWKEKYASLLQVQQLLQATELEQPSLRFSKNIMEEIGRLSITPASKKYINSKIIWGLAAFFFSMIGAFLLYGFLQVDWSASSSSGTPGVDFSSLNLGKIFSNSTMNYFMMADVLIGLLLLDRLLDAKRKRFSYE